MPKTGAHLPAALLHDGLVQGGAEGASSYVSSEGHVVDRVSADRVFRDAMADTGTGVVRRWIVWSAVTVATIFVGADTPWTPGQRRRYRLVAGATLALIFYLGFSASADLVDARAPLAVPLPWMGERPWWLEVLGGLAGAITVPLVLSLAWGRFRTAGAIAGVLLAVLLHVTVALAVITLGYQGLEWLTRRAPSAARLAAVATALAAVGFFGWLSLA